MFNILSIWSGEFKGGAAKRFIELLDGLVKNDYDVTLLSDYQYPGINQVKNHKINLSFANYRTIRNLFNYRVKSEINKYIVHLKPKAVLCFGTADAALLFPIAKKHNIKRLLFIRAFELVLKNNDNIPFQNIKFLRNLVRKLYIQIFRLLINYAFKNSTDIVFQHESQRYKYNKMVLSGKLSFNAHYLPNNSNPSWIDNRIKYKWIKNRNAIVISNLYWNKGFKYLIDSFKYVKTKVHDAKLTILGDGPQGNEIKNYTKTINGIEFKGHRKNIQEYLNQAKLLIFPTLDEYGSPNIIMEASGMGVPMLVSNEAIHTVGNYPGVYNKYDCTELSTLWIRVLTDDEYYKELGEKSSQIGRQYKFDWVDAAKKIIEKTIIDK